MSKIDAQLHHECNIDNDHENLKPKLGKTSKPLEEGVVESEDEELPPSIGKKNRKFVEKMLERTIFVSTE